jgi:hypothetical protein
MQASVNLGGEQMIHRKVIGRGGGDRNDRQTNKACALYALQPPPSTNWNKWNKRQLRPPPNKEGKKSKRFAERRF